MKNIFLNKIKYKINNNNTVITLPVKLTIVNLNLLFIKDNKKLYYYIIDTVKHIKEIRKSTLEIHKEELISTEIQLKSNIKYEVNIDFLKYLYSNNQILKRNIEAKENYILNMKESISSINSKTQYNFKFAYVTIDFTQAVKSQYLTLLSNYIDNSKRCDKKIYKQMNLFDYCDNSENNYKTNSFSQYIKPLFNNEEITYAKVIQVDENYHLTLTTEKMLFIDYLYLSYKSAPEKHILGEHILEVLTNYKPYFYEFIPDKPSILEKYYLKSNNYYVVNFGNYNIGQELVQGTIEFSASPFIYLTKALQLTNPTLVNINKSSLQKLINCTINKVINQNNTIDNITAQFNQLITSTTNTLNIELFDMGNANAIQIGIDGTAKAIIDFGFTNVNSNRLAIESFMSTINDINLILLTHWDLDHIKGISQFELSDYNKTWIIPEPPVNKVSHAALRLICYLILENSIPNSNIAIISKDYNNYILSQGRYFTLGKGSGRGEGNSVCRGTKSWVTRYTSLNNLGLVLALSINESESILFSGDCEYSEFPEDMQTHYTHLIAAHHGAKVNDIALPEDTTAKKNVYFCAKMNNKYPDPKHISLLENYGYTLNQEKHITLTKHCNTVR